MSAFWGGNLRFWRGGDLSYEITEQGRDELCELAHGVNNMRRAVVERQRDEEEARMANQRWSPPCPTICAPR